MTNLKLITTETFGDLSCNFYRNMNDDILLTREQIGQALEYSDPMNAIYKIHKRHQDRLDNLSICLSDGLGHEIYYYNERGIMEICRWSNSKKANLFMDWVWDIIEKYRHNELQSQPNLQSLIDTLSNPDTNNNNNAARYYYIKRITIAKEITRKEILSLENKYIQ